MKILLVGGGSGGPVSPLLAVAEQIKITHPKADFLLVGTSRGPERLMAEKAGMRFTSIAAGKLRRYWSLKNLLTPFEVVAGFTQAIFLLRSYKPNCVFGAGGFVQVPLVWAAWVLRIPVVIHQQDVFIGLANRLTQLAAKKITVTFEETIKNFVSSIGLFYSHRKDRVLWTGNAVRLGLTDINRKTALAEFKLSGEFPVLLVIGGGTGAKGINDILIKSLPELTKIVEIIHVTGSGKFVQTDIPRYHAYEFLDNVAAAYAAADLVISRAGLSTISELSYLGKPAIIIPMPNSHQEINAFYVAAHGAGVVLNQKDITPEYLTQIIRKILIDGGLQKRLTERIGKLMPKTGTEKIAEVVTAVAEGRI